MATLVFIEYIGQFQDNGNVKCTFQKQLEHEMELRTKIL